MSPKVIGLKCAHRQVYAFPRRLHGPGLGEGGVGVLARETHSDDFNLISRVVLIRSTASGESFFPCEAHCVSRLRKAKGHFALLNILFRCLGD
jgi:hypothetical protein